MKTNLRFVFSFAIKEKKETEEVRKISVKGNFEIIKSGGGVKDKIKVLILTF